MLAKLFISVLNMSLISSCVIIFVLIARLLLKKTPKIFSYALWGVVLFRLLCPVSFESVLSLMPIGKALIPQDIIYSIAPQINTGINAVNSMINPILPMPSNIGNSVNPIQIWFFIGTVIWALGMLVMLLYSIVAFVKLKRSLIGAAQLNESIYLADHISSPFVMGLFNPIIYLPSALSDSEKDFIIAHEMCHVRRFDHITRILGFTALTVHWFNPLAWIAFIISGNDMEMSCDEAVMKKMNVDIRSEYSQSLLHFATVKRMIHATPLAFGEGDTKSRVKNVLSYKKTAFWVIVISALACVAAVFCLVSNPKSKMPPILYAYSEYSVIPMNFGTYSWNGVVSDAIPYVDMDYTDFISYSESPGHRNANIFFSTSNKPSDFNSDNAKGINDFKIVEMKRYVNGKEEVLSELDGNVIKVSLELDATYLYEFKVQFGENHAYYSIKINNNVTNSSYDLSKGKVFSSDFPVPEFGTKISETVNLEKGYESISLQDVTREQAASYIKELQDNGWTAVEDFNQETTGGFYQMDTHTLSVQFAGDLLTIYYSVTDESATLPDNVASAEYSFMKIGENGEVLATYSLTNQELAKAIIMDGSVKSAAWEGVDISTLEEYYLIRQSFAEKCVSVQSGIAWLLPTVLDNILIGVLLMRCLVFIFKISPFSSLFAQGYISLLQYNFWLIRKFCFP